MPLKLRIGFVTVDASHADEVSAAVEKSNVRQRLPGLPDTLNPGVLDPVKIVALISAIAKMPADAKSPVADHTLYLNGGDLGIGASAPTTAASFAKSFSLAAIETENGLVTARANVAPDCELAKSRAAEARHQFGHAEHEVQALTAKRDGAAGKPEEGEALRALSGAKSRRFAIVQVWQENAAAVVACLPERRRSREGSGARKTPGRKDHRSTQYRHAVRKSLVRSGSRYVWRILRSLAEKRRSGLHWSPPSQIFPRKHAWHLGWADRP